MRPVISGRFLPKRYASSQNTLDQGLNSSIYFLRGIASVSPVSRKRSCRGMVSLILTRWPRQTTKFSIEVLKQPLRTTIAVEILDFAEFKVEEELHIVISVKDFKSIITHAGITNTNIRALYSKPSSPMQLTYSENGMQCEFILMTTGESRATSITPAANLGQAASKKPAARKPLEAMSSLKRSRSGTEMPPPLGVAGDLAREHTKRKTSRPSPPPPQPSIQSDALFLPADDDHKWDPVNYEDEASEMLLWNVDGDVSSVIIRLFVSCS